MPIKRETVKPTKLSKESFMGYLRANFNLPVEATWLIENILNYVETLPTEQQQPALQKMLGFSIGLTYKEIEMITFGKNSSDMR